LDRTAALLLTFVTGMTGLVYEVTWERYLATLVGSHAEATAAVLGLFLGGLSVGYAVFGVVTRRRLARAAAGGPPARLLWMYGWVEASIGLYALLFPVLFAGARRLSVSLPVGGGAGLEALAFAADVALSALLILPPAILMGGTIPVLTQALSTGIDDATRTHARIYASNTFGAVAGALGAGFFLIPALGLIGTLRGMALLNGLAGAAFLWLGRRERAAEPDSHAPGPQAAEAARGSLGPWALVALLAGFAMMTLQTTVIRLGGLSLGASPFNFSMVVAVFVFGIALGSFGVSALRGVPRWLLPASLGIQLLLLLALHDGLEAAPWAAQLLRSVFRSDDVDFYPFYAAVFGALLAVIGPVVILSGTTLPLVFHHLRDRFGELGSSAGALYSWNTVGSLLGALIGGYALYFWLDLDGVYRSIALALVVATAIAAVQCLELRPLAAAGCAAVPILVVLALLEPWRPQVLAAGLYRSREGHPKALLGPAAVYDTLPSGAIAFYDDDPVASIAVTRSHGPRGASLSLLSNGKSDGNTAADYPTMGLAAILPALLGTGEPERAFVVGFGTGVTAGELAALPSVREVVVAEMSSAVAKAAPLFDFATMQLTKSPKFELVRSDAYRALLRSEGRFDVIVSEPSNLWVPGIEMLYSREFLEAARDRLAPGGVYAQWYHQYETSSEAVSLVLRTYAEVFDRIAVWYGVGPDLLLLGFEQSAARISLDELAKRSARPELAAALERSRVPDLAALTAHELLPMGVVQAARLSGPVHTLVRPRLGYLAARAYFSGASARLPFTGSGAAARIGAERAMFRQLLARERSAPARERLYASYAKETCRHREHVCLAALAAATAEFPDSQAIQRIAARAARRAPRFGPPISQAALRDAAALGSLALQTHASTSPQRGRHLNRVYAHAYHHAMPFSPDTLRAHWARCDGAEACAAGRREAEAMLDGGGWFAPAMQLDDPRTLPAKRVGSADAG
jgi:spermidine synthase